MPDKEPVSRNTKPRRGVFSVVFGRGAVAAILVLIQFFFLFVLFFRLQRSSIYLSWAVSLLADDTASKEELDSAISQLQAAVDALVPAGRAELESTLEQARGYDGSGYTADSFAALQAAIAEAQKALDAAGSDGARWADAQSKLEKAIEGLIPQTEADSNGGVIQDGPDSGVGDGSGDSPAATTAPTAAPSGPRSPSTGDETVLAPWVLMMALSAALLAAMALRRKKCR